MAPVMLSTSSRDALVAVPPSIQSVPVSMTLPRSIMHRCRTAAVQVGGVSTVPGTDKRPRTATYPAAFRLTRATTMTQHGRDAVFRYKWDLEICGLGTAT